jgi:hypothetical protein
MESCQPIKRLKCKKKKPMQYRLLSLLRHILLNSVLRKLLCSKWAVSRKQFLIPKFICWLVVGSDDSASSEGETEFCFSYTNNFRQLLLRHYYFAAPGVLYPVRTDNAGPQLYATSDEGNIVAV